MTTWAIIPVKPLNRAKSRLAPVLEPEVRLQLAMAMLHRSMSVLSNSEDISGILVISRDARALVIAREYGAKTVQESGAPELNAALQRAAQVITSWSAKAALIIPADLPLISEVDVNNIVQLGRYYNSVVIAPDRRENGTNGLLMRPPGMIECAFGPGSFERHHRLAVEQAATVETYRSERTMLDLDTPEDLLAYLAMCKQLEVEPLIELSIEKLPFSEKESV